MSRKKSYFTNILGVPERIKKIRGNLTQLKFGKLVGVTQGSIQKYEKGIMLPTKDILNKIADYGEVAVEWILRGDEAAPHLLEHAPETYHIHCLEPLEAHLLHQVLAEMEEYLKAKSLHLNLPQRARLITLIYNHCAQEFDQPCLLLVEKYLLLLDIYSKEKRRDLL
jgi:transcriptional regulator with XRE-family HTH domain